MGYLTTVCFAVMWSPSSSFRRLRQADHIAEGKVRPQHRELHALLFSTSVWDLKRPTGFMNIEGCETGPTVYRPYPRRLESLTICGCNYKGSTFSSVILRPEVELTTSCMAARFLNQLSYWCADRFLRFL